jgi:PPM family protein phosphatase
MRVARESRPAKLVLHRTWSDLFRQVDEAVEADPATGFTALVGLAVLNGRVDGASHGDSAAMLLDRDRQRKLTHGQHKNPPIGSGGAAAVPFAATADGPWQLIVMTDGVWKYAGWSRIVEAARRTRGPELLDELQRAARLPGSGLFQDDFTAVLFESDLDAAAN